MPIRTLIICPDMGLDVQGEIVSASSGFAPKILAGTVTRQRALEEIASGAYDIVHLATHGRAHVLQMSDGILEEEMLEHAVRKAGSLRVLLLNACKSAHTAVEVYNHTPVSYSVGWPFDVADAAALTWARLFYDALRIDPDDVKRAAQVANESVVKSYHIDPDRLPLVLNGRVGQVLADCQRLQAELQRPGVVRLPAWAVAANALLVALLLASVLLLAAAH